MFDQLHESEGREGVKVTVKTNEKSLKMNELESLVKTDGCAQSVYGQRHLAQRSLSDNHYVTGKTKDCCTL